MSDIIIKQADAREWLQEARAIAVSQERVGQDVLFAKQDKPHA